MFNPADKQPVSAEMLDLMQQIDTQKKKRSDAVARLKECAEEVIKDVGDETQIFTLKRLSPKKSRTGPVADSAPEAPQTLTHQREQAKKARSDRKSRLEVLKRTTVNAVNGIRKSTRYLDPEKLKEHLENAETGNNGTHEYSKSATNGTNP